MRIIRRRIVPLCALGVLSAVTYFSPDQQEPTFKANYLHLYVESPTVNYNISFHIEPSETLYESKLVTKLFEK